MDNAGNIDTYKFSGSSISHPPFIYTIYLQAGSEKKCDKFELSQGLDIFKSPKKSLNRTKLWWTCVLLICIWDQTELIILSKEVKVNLGTKPRFSDVTLLAGRERNHIALDIKA